MQGCISSNSLSHSIPHSKAETTLVPSHHTQSQFIITVPLILPASFPQCKPFLEGLLLPSLTTPGHEALDSRHSLPPSLRFPNLHSASSYQVQAFAPCLLVSARPISSYSVLANAHHPNKSYTLPSVDLLILCQQWIFFFPML